MLPVFMLFIACELEEPSVKKTETDTTPLDFSKYVAIGNSLTAGYQSGSLVEEHQMYSYPNLIAQQLGIADFEQPTVSWPGVPNIMTLESVTGTLGTASGTGAPTNLTLARPYDNMGIPGIVLADVENATSTADSYSKSAAIDLVLRGLGTQLAQATSLNPKLITCWIGNNDVLGFATSGGASPTEPTDAATFNLLYQSLGAKLAASGAKVVLATIPNVTAIPFFTTIGPMVAAGVQGAKQLNPAVVGLYYQKHGKIVANPNTDFTNFDEAVPPLITLVGATYAGLLGQPTGKWYRDLAAKTGYSIDIIMGSNPGIDTTQAFGFHPQNPWPDALVLDADEIATAATATAAFNSSISTIASASGFALFDANDFFDEIVADGGYDPGNGMDMLTTSYISGGLFSLDGVHPTNLCYAILANQFITAANEKFGIHIQPVNLRDVIGQQPQTLAKLAKVRSGVFNNVVSIFGGEIK